MRDDGKAEGEVARATSIVARAGAYPLDPDRNRTADEFGQADGIELHVGGAVSQARQGVVMADSERVIIPIGTSLESAQRSLIMATLQAVDGSKSKAAAILGVSLKTLYNRLHAYGEPLDQRLRMA